MKMSMDCSISSHAVFRSVILRAALLHCKCHDAYLAKCSASAITYVSFAKRLLPWFCPWSFIYFNAFHLISHNKHTPISFAEECVSLSCVFVFSLAALSNPLLLLLALYVLRFSFYSVRLMLSIYGSKFAPILWHENTHLPFCFLFSLFSLSLAVLNNRFLWLIFVSHPAFFLDWIFSRLSRHDQHDHETEQAFFQLIARSQPDSLWQCVPAFPYIDIANSNGSGLSQNNKARKLLNRKSFVCSECTKVRVLSFIWGNLPTTIGNCKPPSVKLYFPRVPIAPAYRRLL